jgi:hypothetical protein
MNAHCRSIDDWTVTDLDPFDAIDPRITDKARGLHRVHRWVFFPYGCGEANGAMTLFDGRFYPMARKNPDGSVEILPMLDFKHPPMIEFKKLRFLYGSFDHPSDDEKTQQRLLAMVGRLCLGEEVYRRYDAYYRKMAERRRNFRRYLANLAGR